MPRVLEPLVAALALSAVPACVLDELELAERPCPCIQGYVCDPARNVCIVPPARPDAAVPDTAVPDASEPIPCTVDRDCGDPPNRVCVDEVCVPGCMAEGAAACVAPAACDPASGHCLVEGACQTPNDCAPPVSVCIAGRCEPGCGVAAAPCRLDRVCDASTGVCRSSPPCDTDAACPLGYWCDGKSCRQRCDQPGAPACRGDGVCSDDTGRCEGAFDIGSFCTADRGCASGDCLGLVVGGLTQRVCSRTCAASAECPLGTTCIPVSDAGQCVPSDVFSTDPPLSDRSGASCDPQANTCQSLLCEGSTCVERCFRDRACAALTGACVAVPQDLGPGNRVYIPRCIEPFVGSQAGETCSSNLDCAHGLCDPDTGTCARLCCAESDCGQGESCVPTSFDQSVLRVCKPRSFSGGRALGAPCETDADCESEVCSPTDPGNPNGAKVCSTYCCNDADCDPMPTGSRRCVTLPGPIDGSVTGRCVVL